MLRGNRSALTSLPSVSVDSGMFIIVAFFCFDVRNICPRLKEMASTPSWAGSVSLSSASQAWLTPLSRRDTMSRVSAFQITESQGIRATERVVLEVLEVRRVGFTPHRAVSAKYQCNKIVVGSIVDPNSELVLPYRCVLDHRPDATAQGFRHKQRTA